MKDETMPVLKPWQSLLVGTIAGITQSVVSFPFWTMKVRQQCHLPRTFDPRILYKGFVPATVAITCMSIAQVYCTTVIHRWLHQAHSTDSTEENSFERIQAALIGGAVATMVSNPIGVVITQQHKINNPHFTNTLRGLVEKRGYSSLYISFFCNLTINTAFTLSFYALYPMLYQSMTRGDHQEVIATFTASCCLGLIMSSLLQPLDTLKTAQEYHVDERSLYLSAQLREQARPQNLRALYRGFFPAAVSTISAVAAAGLVLQKAENHFLHSQGAPAV